MDGMDRIVARIQADAKKHADEILARAQHEANEIRESFAAIAKEEAAAITEKGRKLADERALRLGGVAQLEARKMRLRTKQQMIDLAFKYALEDLRARKGDAYVETLATLAAEAAVSSREEVILSPEDRETYGATVTALANKKLAARGALTLSEETRPIAGGLVLKQDALEVDASFETLMRLQRDELASEVANILFS